MDEVIKTAVQTLQGEGDAYVELSKVREDASGKKYFQLTLFKPLWEDATFVLYFQSRPGVYDFETKIRGVRLRSALADQIEEVKRRKRRTAPLPERLYEALLRAGSMPETVAAVSGASPVEVGALPMDTIEALLD